METTQSTKKKQPETMGEIITELIQSPRLSKADKEALQATLDGNGKLTFWDITLLGLKSKGIN